MVSSAGGVLCADACCVWCMEYGVRHMLYAICYMLYKLTPHWSKLLIPHTKPCTATRCSYRASSCPHDLAERVGKRSDSDGRFPENSL